LLDVNVVEADAISTGCLLMVFRGALTPGKRLSLSMGRGEHLWGRVVRLASGGQAILRIDGRTWWARRAPHRRPAYVFAKAEEWEIVAGLA
jgi:hypothetical protein